jgi:hypothetical protein
LVVTVCSRIIPERLNPTAVAAFPMALLEAATIVPSSLSKQIRRAP